jgi:PAS domain S-box-containing protein
MKTFKKYSIVSGTLVVILLFAGAAAYKNFLDLAEVNRLETNNHIILKKIEIVFGKVTDAETGQRGYIITGNEDYLKPYHAAVATIDEDIKELRSVTKVNADYQQILNTLEPLIAEKLSGLANRINIRKNKGFDAAALEVRTGKGKDIMDKIRKTINKMEDEIRKSMEQKRKKIELKSKHTAYYILLGSSLAALIVVISSFITRKEIIVRSRAEEELKKYTEHLEVAVSERTNELTKTNKQLEKNILEHKKTENNLKESEIRYRSLFKNSPISLWEEDFSDVKKYIDSLRSKGVSNFRTYFQDHPEDVINCATMVKVVDVNEVTLKMYQAGSVEDLMKGLDSVFVEESYKVFKEALIALIEGKSIYESEGVIRTLDGRKIHVFIMWAVPPDYKDTWSKAMVSMIDITQRKIAEETLRLYQNRIETLINSSRDIMFLKDNNFRYLIANKANESLFNIKVEDIIYKTDFDFMPKELAETCRKSDEMALISEIAIESEEAFRDKWFHIVKQKIVDEKGNIVGIVAVIRDITERKRMEEQLKAAATEWRMTFDSASELIIMLDIERKIIKANLATARFLGKSFSEIIGKKCCELFHVTDEHPAACPFKRMITNGKHEEAEFYLSEKNTWIRVSIDPTFDEHGNLVGGIHIIRDITESKRSKDQLRVLNEELRNLADHLQTLREEERIIISRDIHDELGQKLSGLKFELLYLKNMISGIKGNYHIFLEKIQSISKNIDSLIYWSRNLTTRLRPSIIDDMGLEAALEWLIKDFERRSQISCAMNIFLRGTRLDDKMSIAVFRICQECLTNIARHANATAVVVNLDENEERIILKISDNGIGITKEQVNSSKSFGLIGMRERTIVLGGDFVIKGEEGKGTKVTVAIPKRSMDMK